jgi:hypothetical protein
MKTKLIISAILFALIIQANAQTIPNAGFENWTMQPGGYEDPDNWATLNYPGWISVSKTSDSYSGNFALQVTNNALGLEGPLPGFALIVFTDTNVINKISAYVKCDSISGTGKGIIKVWGFLGGLTTPIGLWETNTEISQYTLIDIPLSPINNYDSMMVEIMGFAENAPNGTSTGYALFTVDEMTEEISSGITETNISDAIKIYPNPFREYTMLTFENLKCKNCFLTIYDSKGNVVQIIDKIDNGQIKIERNNLADGIYYFQDHSESAFIGTGKFVLQTAD